MVVSPCLYFAYLVKISVKLCSATVGFTVDESIVANHLLLADDL